MSISRKATNEIIELAEEGILSWEQVAMACLSYMSEGEVREMGEFNGFVFEEDEDDEVPTAPSKEDVDAFVNAIADDPNSNFV